MFSVLTGPRPSSPASSLGVEEHIYSTLGFPTQPGMFTQRQNRTVPSCATQLSNEPFSHAVLFDLLFV